LSETLTISKNNPSCFQGNNSNGNATANYSGLVNLVNPYTWSNGATTQTITSLVAGTYTVTISSTGGCTVSASIIITSPPQLSSPSTTTTPAICDGQSGGTLSILVTGGTKPWQFTINNLPTQTSNVFTNLPAATYSVTVTDFNGCTATTTATTVGKIPQLPLSGTAIAGQAYDIVGTVALTGSLTVSGCTLYAMDNSSITVPPNTPNTLSLTTTTISSCNNMWQGIINNGGTVIIDNCIIKDAENALFANTANSKFNVTNSTFNRNYISVSLLNGNYSTSTFTNSQFICDASLKTQHPLSSDLTLSQFYIENATVDLNGGASHNILRHANNGIYVTKYSTLYADNLIIENLTSNTVGNTMAAINASNYCSVFVGQTAPVTFANCTLGIYSENNFALKAQRNIFNNCACAVTSKINGANDIYIFDNDFTNCLEGIVINDLNKYTVGCQIKQNRFYGKKDAGIPSSEVAVLIFNFNLYQVPVHIDYNQIYDYPYSIYVMNLNGDKTQLATINNNTINYTFNETQLGWNVFYGVVAQSCDALRVNRNEVNWTAGPADPAPYNQQMIGYYFAECKNSTIFKNNAVKCGTGMDLYAQCTNTFLVCNHLENVYPGILMEHLELPHQGISCKSNENYWSGAYLANGQNDSYKKIKGTVQQPINWYYNSAATNPNPYFPPGILFPISTSCTSWPPVCGVADNTVAQYDAMDNYINRVVNDSLQFYDNAAENFYKATNYAYTEMKANDSLVNTTDREQFMTATAETNIGLFDAVNDSMATVNLSGAAVINTTIIDTNLIENNSKQVNTIKMNLLQNDTLVIAAADTVTLENISYQNAETGGKAVYEARALLHKKIIDHALNSSFRMAAATISPTANELLIYPNPTQKFATVFVTNTSSYIKEISLFDLTGRKLKHLFIKTNTNQYKLDLADIAAGTYRISVTTIQDQFSRQLVIIR
jgi:hypothetical protein